MNTFVSFNKLVAITPSDSVDFAAGPSTEIYVGGAGVVAAVLEDSTVVNLTAIAGARLPIRIKRVNLTNTTATLLVGLYRV